MKKYLLFIIAIIITSGCTFCLGLNWNPGEITEKEAIDIAEKIIEREENEPFIESSSITVKNVYEVARFLEGVSDVAISVYVDKTNGRVVNIVY